MVDYGVLMEFIFFLQAESRSVNCSNLAKMVLFIEETYPCLQKKLEDGES